MTYENLLFEVKNENTALITFNRPKALNALNQALMAEFSTALDHLREDTSIRVLVLTGAGEKAFVAGADINELATYNALQAKRFSMQGHAVISKLQSLPFPVIAAVNGFALGGGCEIALACDLIFASAGARMGLPEITLGIIPGFGGTQRLPRLIGANRAKELIFTGRMLSADEGREMGLVNQVCPDLDLMETVLKTAAVMAEKGRVALRAAKEAVNRGLNVDLASGCEIEIDAFSLCMASTDAREGTRAFLEKRKPCFKGTFDS